MLRSFTGTWLPLGLGFLATWITGALMATLPWPKPGKGSEVADPMARGAH